MHPRGGVGRCCIVARCLELIAVLMLALAACRRGDHPARRTASQSSRLPDQPCSSGMIYVPPAIVTFGAALAPNGIVRLDEAPRRDFQVHGFCIDALKVSNADYSRCLASGHCAWSGDRNELPSTDVPVTNVTIDQARDYCRWRGNRLPTEHEWEYAARGALGRNYPWGDSPPTADQACFATIERPGLCPRGTHPAGRSPTGMWDAASNGLEWVADVDDRGASGHLADRRVDLSSFDTHCHAAGVDESVIVAARGTGYCADLSAGRCGGVWVREAVARCYLGPELGFRCAADVRRVGEP
jgi:formylglycine-generating enzyme required for sulfatase activity